MPNDTSRPTTIQSALIARALERAYSLPPEGSAADHGWGCAARLVMYWLANPDSVPTPQPEPLRGLVFIESDGTIRPATAKDI